MAKRVGVKDIAAKAGVSIGTVDRVLHDRGEVKKETREKILTIVKEMGYTPNVMARSLAAKKTRRIVILIPDPNDNNPYWEKPKRGIAQAAEELLSHNVEIVYKPFTASNEESYRNALEEVMNEDLDGIVMNPIFKATSLHYISQFNQRKIPYVFIDINIEGVGNIGYFGQDAEQSGFVAARLLNYATPPDANILIVKPSEHKIYSQHIESRVAGFTTYFKKQKQSEKKINIVEIDLLKENEPYASLSGVFKDHKTVDGIFVPNTRTFKIASFLESENLQNIITIGYDLVDENVALLEKGIIDFLISQKPEEQSYKALMALFDHCIQKKQVQKTNYSAIDIIIKENIEYYKAPQTK